MGKEELRWSVQNMPVQDWRGTQRESLGNVICASKVKLQHLPFQVGHSLGSAGPRWCRALRQGVPEGSFHPGPNKRDKVCHRSSGPAAVPGGGTCAQ